MDSWSGAQRQNLSVVKYHFIFPQGVISSDGLEKKKRGGGGGGGGGGVKREQNVEVNVNKNTDENEIK